MDLIGIFRTFNPTTKEYTFLTAHTTFPRIDHILDHKASLSNFEKTEIIPIVFFKHSDMKLQINNSKMENSLICANQQHTSE